MLFGIVFFRLWYLQVLTGEEARVSASQNGRRTEKIEAPRGDIVDRNGVAAGADQARGGRPARALDAAQAGARRRRELPQGARRGRARAPARRRTPTTRSGASCATTGASRPRTRSASSAAAEGAERDGAQGRDPARSRTIPELARPLPPHLGGHQRLAATIHSRVIRGIADTPYSNVTIRTDVPPAAVQLHARAAGVLQGHRRRPAQPAPLPARASSPRSCSARSRRSPRTSATATTSTTRASRRARGSARAASSGSTTTSCAARTARRA